MVITVFEYAKRFPYKGKEVSPKTVIRKCEKNLLPSDHHARQLPCESGGKGQWVIEIPDEAAPEIVITKTNPTKPDIKTMNRKYYSFR